MEENMKKSYTTNKYLKEYYKANIEVHISYLLFINRTGKYSNYRCFETAPKIVEIKERLLDMFDENLIVDSSFSIDRIVEENVRKLLKEYELDDLIPCERISSDNVVNLTVAYFLNEQLKTMGEMSCQTQEDGVVNYILENLKKIIPTAHKVIDVEDSMQKYFLQTLKMKDDKDSCIQQYLYAVLYGFNAIIDVLSRKNHQDRCQRDIKSLILELHSSFFIQDIGSLCNILEYLNELTMVLKQQNKGVLLEKKPHYAKISE